MTESMKQAKRIHMTPDNYAPFNIALGYRVGNLVFISGQAAIDDQGKVVGVGNFDAQADKAFDNLRRVLEAAGSNMKKIVKVNIYLTDMTNFPKIVGLRAKHFSKPYPADTIVEVRGLALKELMIEIEAMALIEGEVID